MTDKKHDPPNDKTNPSSNGAEDDDEKVGYGNPPKAHRFPKGTSGNKLGRPKKRPSKGDAALAILDRPTTVNISGTTRKMSTWDALMHAAIALAIKGRHKPLIDLLKISGALKILDEQRVVEETPRVRVTFSGPIVSAAGEMIRTDAEGNVWTNPEGSNYATVLLRKADKAED